MSSLFLDLRAAIRSLRRTPVWTTVAVLTLSVSITAVTLVFSEVNAVFLRPLPVNAPEQLRQLSWTSPRHPFTGDYMARGAANQPMLRISYAAYLSMQAASSRIATTCVWGGRTWVMATAAGTFNVQLVTGTYFDVVGIRITLGRPLLASDDRPGTTPVAVISERMWRLAYEADPAIVGRTIRIRDTAFQVVGVTRGFAGIDPASPQDVFVPYAHSALVTYVPIDRQAWGSCAPLVRLAAGVRDAAAQAEAELLMRDFIAATPPAAPYDPPQVRLTGIARGADTLRRATLRPLSVLLAAGILVLLIACANGAGLLLVRALDRRDEHLTRLALGASRLQLARRVLFEAIVVSAAAAGATVLLVYTTSPFLPNALQQLTSLSGLGGSPHAGSLAVDAPLDTRVLLFAIAATLVTATLVGAWPALVVARHRSLAPGDTRTMTARAPRLSVATGLIAVQVALAVVTLTATALVGRSLHNLWTVSIGYEPESMAYVVVDNASTRAAVDSLLVRLSGIAGVSSVAASQWPLFTNAIPDATVCLGDAGETQRRARVDSERVTPAFFATWGVPLVGGRGFGPAATHEAVVNEAFVRTYLHDRVPVGQAIGLGDCPGTPLTIVGVATDHTDQPRVAATPMIYVPYRLLGPAEPMTFTLRTRGDESAIMPAVRTILADSGLQIGSDLWTGIEYRDRTFNDVRALASLLTLLAAMALGLSALGIFGQVAAAIRRRRREIGLRLALGARPPHLVSAIARPSASAMAAGAALGVALALLSAPVLSALLFEVPAGDPISLTLAILAISISAAIAAALPLHEALSTDPATTLRGEWP
jgi:predicted permease